MDYRTITEEEIDPFFGSLAAAFAEAHPDPDEVRSDRMVLEPDRTFAAFDDGRIVGCAGVFTAADGRAGRGLVPTSGITFVGVLPTHRRRGIFRELMNRMCAQAIERGEVVTTLFASEAAIYGGFGFAAAAHHLGVRRRARSCAVGARDRADRARDAAFPGRGDAGDAGDLRPGVPHAARAPWRWTTDGWRSGSGSRPRTRNGCSTRSTRTTRGHRTRSPCTARSTNGRADSPAPRCRQAPCRGRRPWRAPRCGGSCSTSTSCRG